MRRTENPKNKVRILEFPQPLVVVKRKQGQKGLCNLRGDGNCHLTRLKEAEKLHECVDTN